MQPKSYQLRPTSALAGLAAVLLLAGCGRPPAPAADPDLAAEIAGEIANIRAIDNHAHPVRAVPNGQPADREFDALPVDNMEPQSDPVNLRPGAPLLLEAAKALYGSAAKARTMQDKARTMQEKGDRYPVWVLDQMGVEVMLANRVAMGPSLQPPRFRWVPYADALLFPLDNSSLAAKTPDQTYFDNLPIMVAA